MVLLILTNCIRKDRFEEGKLRKYKLRKYKLRKYKLRKYKLRMYKLRKYKLRKYKLQKFETLCFSFINVWFSWAPGSSAAARICQVLWMGGGDLEFYLSGVWPAPLSHFHFKLFIFCSIIPPPINQPMLRLGGSVLYTNSYKYCFILALFCF